MIAVNQIDHEPTSKYMVAENTHAKFKQISKEEGLPIKIILDLMIEAGDLNQIRSFGDYLADKYMSREKER
jgi:hypothetical protein